MREYFLKRIEELNASKIKNEMELQNLQVAVQQHYNDLNAIHGGITAFKQALEELDQKSAVEGQDVPELKDLLEDNSNAA